MTKGENAVVVVNRIMSVVVGVSALAVALASPSVHAQDHNVLNSTPAISLSEAREAIDREETLWAQARGSIDKQRFENVLAPTFYAQLPGRRLTREEFIAQISSYPTGVKLTRFDNKVLTVQQEGDTSVALILEKLEFERHTENGKTRTEYSMWVTRDAWKKIGDEWKALFSEVVGVERWRNGERPPMKDW